MRSTLLRLLLGVCCIGCTETTTVCLKRDNPLDPLVSAVDRDPEANAKLRAFFSAARGLRDAIGQAEETTRLACIAIAVDLGANQGELEHPNIPTSQRTRIACAQATARIEQVLRTAPNQIQFTWSLPSCSNDRVRQGRCEALCALGSGQGISGYCASTCLAQSNIYSQCSASDVHTHVLDQAASIRQVVLLAMSMKRNLPWLVHTYAALGDRMKNDVTILVKNGKTLPNLVPKAGPSGLACLAAAVQLIDEARAEFDEVFSVTAGVIKLLPVTAVAPQASEKGEG